MYANVFNNLWFENKIHAYIKLVDIIKICDEFDFIIQHFLDKIDTFSIVRRFDLVE